LTFPIRKLRHPHPHRFAAYTNTIPTGNFLDTNADTNRLRGLPRIAADVRKQETPVFTSLFALS
jgi:hypothetical protein